MTLKEMSVEYTESANLISARIRELRAEKKAANSPTASYKIDRRIKELTPMLQECRDLAELTARYYNALSCRSATMGENACTSGSGKYSNRG